MAHWNPATIAWAALLAWARVAGWRRHRCGERTRRRRGVGGVEGPLGVDVDRLVSDARWAAGWPQPSVEHVLRAVEHYDAEALPVLSDPAGCAAGRALERLSEPLFGLYADAADQVLVIGAPGPALTLRRRLVDLLGTLAVRRAGVQPLLVTALDDLAHDLRTLGRTAEAGDPDGVGRLDRRRVGRGRAPGRAGARCLERAVVVVVAAGVRGVRGAGGRHR